MNIFKFGRCRIDQWPTHNNQIKKEAANAAPIIHSVMCAFLQNVYKKFRVQGIEHVVPH
jgi:hypothetical protein